MAENGPDPLEVVCHYCGSVYHYPSAEVQSFLC
jgi:redox-regulated HSP33 family molecular chaperone